MEPYYTNTDSNSGMYSMHTVQQPADLNNSLLNQPFNPSATYQHSAQQPTPKKSHPKRYQCTREGCERMFAGPHNVNQHIREAHTGERPYKCPECTALGHDKAFARPFSLNRHRRQRHHVESGVQARMSDQQGPGVMAAGDADVAGMFRGMLFGNENAQVLQPAPMSMGGSQNATTANAGAQSEEDEWFKALVGENITGLRVPGDAVDFQDFQDWGADASIDDFFNTASDQMDVEKAFNKPDALGCGYCDQFKSEDINPLLLHQHDKHFVPNTPLCDCTVCKMLYVGHEDDPQALAHAQQLEAGALDMSVPEDGAGAADVGMVFDGTGVGGTVDFIMETEDAFF